MFFSLALKQKNRRIDDDFFIDLSNTNEPQFAAHFLDDLVDFLVVLGLVDFTVDFFLAVDLFVVDFLAGVFLDVVLDCAAFVVFDLLFVVDFFFVFFLFLIISRFECVYYY